MVGRLVGAARLAIDAGRLESIGGLGRQQQMIDAQSLVALPAAGLVVPEGVEPRLRMQRPDGIGVAEVRNLRTLEELK